MLGRAAVWLNAKMPEIVEVRVADLDELEDEEVVRNEVRAGLSFAPELLVAESCSRDPVVQFCECEEHAE